MEYKVHTEFQHHGVILYATLWLYALRDCQNKKEKTKSTFIECTLYLNLNSHSIRTSFIEIIHPTSMLTIGRLIMQGILLRPCFAEIRILVRTMEKWRNLLDGDMNKIGGLKQTPWANSTGISVKEWVHQNTNPSTNTCTSIIWIFQYTSWHLIS